MAHTIGINALSYYLQRITSFIESGKKTLLFPNISTQLEEVLLKLVRDKDTSFFQSNQFIDKVKMEAAKLSAAIESHINVELVHEYQDGEHGANVLMFKKIEVNPFKAPEPLRRPKEVQLLTMDTKDDRLEDALVTSIFKTCILNTTTKFVKDDKQLILKYPAMAESQAEFLMSMLLQGKEGNTEQMDLKFGYRSMYAPLWEAMRVFGLKYDYKIEYMEERFRPNDMKCIVFEKIPKIKEPEKMDVVNPEDLEVQTLTKDTKDDRLEDALVTSIFKTRIHNTTTKFVKDDKQLILKYPAMAESQAEFLMSMLLQGKEGNTEQMDLKFGCRSRYAPLWEAMRVFGLKYDYKIEYMEERFRPIDMKCIVFEKIPKIKEPEKMDVDNPEDLNTSISTIASITSSSTATSTANSVTSTPKKRNKSKEPRPEFKVSKKMRKIQKLITKIMHDMANGHLTDEFIQDTLSNIANYLSTGVEESIVFERMTVCQEYFLNNVKRLCKNDKSYMLFNGACQKHLVNIKYYLANKIKYTVKVVNSTKKKALKDIEIKKKHVIAKTKMKAQEKNKKAINPLLSKVSNTPQAKQEHKSLANYKTIKDRVEDAYIHKTLQELTEFLSKDNTKRSITFEGATLGQEEFIKHIHVWSKIDEAYEMFSCEDQKLLEEIKLKAKNYKLRVVGEVQGVDSDEIVSDVTIVKKLANSEIEQKIVKRPAIPEIEERCVPRQPIDGKSAWVTSFQRSQSVKAKLIEALNQPVQSDKAVRMMQSMGWDGGALGLRGNGITEPIKPSLDIANRAGLGHVNQPPRPLKPKQQQPKLQQPKLQQPKLQQPKHQQPTQWNLPPSEFFPRGILPLAALQPSLIPKEIIHPGAPTLGSELVLLLEDNYRVTIFEGILRLITTNLGSLRFNYLAKKPKPVKVIGFVREAIIVFNRRMHWAFSDKILAEIVANIQAVLSSCHQLKLNVEIFNDCRSAVVQKCSLPPNNNNKTEKNNTTSTSQQNSKHPPQIVDYIDLTGEYVVQVGKHSDGTSTIENVYSKKGTPLKHTPYLNIDLTQTPDELQDIKTITANNNIEAHNTTAKKDTNKQSNISNSDKENLKSDRNVQNGVATVKIAKNVEQMKPSNNNIDKNDIKNCVNAAQNNTKKYSSNNQSARDDGKNTQTIQNDSDNGNLAQKDVNKLSSFNNSVQNDANNGQAVQNDKETVNTAQNDIKKHSSNNKSDNDAKNDLPVENDEITVSYITLVDCKATTATDNTQIETELNTDTTDNITTNDNKQNINLNANSNNKTNNTQTSDKSDELSDAEDDDCQVIIDTSETPIEILSEDEDLLLYSDEETQTDKPTNRTAIDKTNSIKLEQELNNSIIKANDLSKEITIKIDIDQFDSGEETVEKDELDTPIQERKLVKRPSLDSPNEDQRVKKSKLVADFKKLCILPKDYPQIKINREKAREIQTSIITAIDYTKTLPMLKCEGIQNGGLVYSCQDDESLFFMEGLIKSMDDLMIVYEFDVKEKLHHKMAFRINSFLEEDFSKILKRLELFNSGLIATKWGLIKKEQYNNFVVIYVELDDSSFRYICDANFSLYAGNDCAKFSIVWD